MNIKLKDYPQGIFDPENTRSENILKRCGRWSFIIILMIIPVLILVENYSSQHGFLSLILFGQEFKATRLHEINSLNPPTKSQWGYDGQFYAQIALDPLLSRDDLKQALDAPSHRARRIGLSFFAFCLGLGKPLWILQVYALLNVVFWLLLLGAVCKFTGYKRGRDFLLLIAVLWSTGTLTSIARALTDFPAAALSAIAAFLFTNRLASASLLSFAALVIEH